MGNTNCCLLTIASSRRRPPATLIFHDGTSRILAGKRRLAGEVMFEFPECMVCHAHSFFIGQPLPVLSIDDVLTAGQTFLVLPLDSFATNVLSASSLAALRRAGGGAGPVNFKSAAFEYVKGSNGRVLIKVVPEFIVSLMSGSNKDNNLPAGEDDDDDDDGKILCSTPELKKHYEQLVGPKDQVSWSPKLETITEYKLRYSPCRFIGLEWKQKEGEDNK